MSRFRTSFEDVIIIPKDEFKKHLAGKHDQATHGNWDTDKSNNTKSDFKYAVQNALDKVIKGEVGQVVPTDAEFWLEQMADRKDNPDLTNLEIVGTQLFTRDNLGIPRDKMPQVPSGAKDEFLTLMKERGIAVVREEISPQALHPIQAEISASKSGQIMQDIREKGHKKGDGARIVVSSDNYVIDGHHRWAASAFLSFKNKGEKIPVLRVNMKHLDLIKVTLAWNKTMGIEGIALGASNTFKKAWIEFDLAVIRAILSTEVEKHRAGQHDQSSHGSWASGGGEMMFPQDEHNSLFLSWQESSRALSAWKKKQGKDYWSQYDDREKPTEPEGAKLWDEAEGKIAKWESLAEDWGSSHFSLNDGGWDVNESTNPKVLDARGAYVVADTPTLKMNRALREGTKSMRHLVRSTDLLTSQGVVTRPVQVFRGVVLPKEVEGEFKVGHTFVEKGFMSTDRSFEGAEFYAETRRSDGAKGNLVLMRLTLATGTKAVYVGSHEVVVARNAKMTITNVEKSKKKISTTGSLEKVDYTLVDVSVSHGG